MIKILCLFIGFAWLTTIVYDFSVNTIEGNTISLSQYKGKKILFVNTASSGPYTGQYAGLEKLYQKYKDSLVIIAVPSNSFGKETGTNAAIRTFITGAYHTHFIITEKTMVYGTDQSPLYAWLTHIDQNGMMTNTINDDFYKFLVDGSGKLVGAFVSSVDPMSNEIQNAIKN